MRESIQVALKLMDDVEDVEQAIKTCKHLQYVRKMVL